MNKDKSTKENTKPTSQNKKAPRYSPEDLAYSEAILGSMLESLHHEGSKPSEQQ